MEEAAFNPFAALVEPRSLKSDAKAVSLDGALHEPDGGGCDL